MDCGKLAVSACSRDGRGVSRTASSVVYPEDYPSEYCDCHVSTTLCSGGGVPNEWCQKFADVGVATISSRSYVRMTADEYNWAAKAVNCGLPSSYVSRGAIMVGGSVTTTTCEEHTAEAWAAWEIANATTETTPSGGETGGEAGGEAGGGTETPAPTVPPATEAPAA